MRAWNAFAMKGDAGNWLGRSFTPRAKTRSAGLRQQIRSNSEVALVRLRSLALNRQQSAAGVFKLRSMIVGESGSAEISRNELARRAKAPLHRGYLRALRLNEFRACGALGLSRCAESWIGDAGLDVLIVASFDPAGREEKRRMSFCNAFFVSRK